MQIYKKIEKLYKKESLHIVAIFCKNRAKWLIFIYLFVYLRAFLREMQA